MNKTWIVALTLLSILFLCSLYARFDQEILISPAQAEKMGQLIWQNECRGKVEGLTSWNQGEDFASLGIGHFIWYPEGKSGSFKQTFPDLILFLKQENIPLPEWLQTAKGAPWPSKEAFQQELQEPKLIELRQLLVNTVPQQVIFMINRLQKALPTLISRIPEERKQHITTQFYRLSQTPNGIYVLLDYLNFKGEGVLPQESYQGEGWGLLQVLNGMSGLTPGFSAVEEFVAVSKEVLKRRVEHSPPERNEKRWLKGWTNRLDSYLHVSFCV